MRERDNNFYMDFEDTGFDSGMLGGYDGGITSLLAAQEAQRQAEATRLAQEAEQARQTQIQAQLMAEQRAYEEQAYRQAQVRQEELRAQNAARLAAEQEAARQAQAEQQAQLAQAEQQRQIAAQQETQRQAETTAPQAPVNDYIASLPQPETTVEDITRIFDGSSRESVDRSPTEDASARDATIEALIKQIQARSDTSRWTGGYGADQATKDMARILAETGITDISQFGPITREVQKVVGYEDWGDPIYQTVTEQTFGNKETGQAVPNTYTERQTGNFFGGTYEGKGNTGYGVQFDDQGLPVFYTQGASSSDMGSIAPFLTLASFVPGLQPFAMAANAAIAAKQDNPLGVITNLAGVGNLAGVSGMADVANAARFAGAVKSGDPLAMAFSGANLAGVSDVGGVNLKDVSKAIGAVKAIESGDPLTMMLYGMDVMSGSGGSSPTKSSADLQKETPLTPEEQEQLIENRLNTAISRSQISPEEEDANTQRAIEELERIYGPESTTTLPSLPTRSLGEPQVEEVDDFLKSIGINTIDKPSDGGLSNQDILNLINADNEVLVTSNRDTVGKGVSEDIFKNLEDAGEPILPTPAEKLSELVIKGDRPKEETTVQQEPANIDEFIKSLEPYKAPITDLERLVITGNRDTVGKGVSEDIFRNLEDAGEPLLPLPVADSNRVEIVGNRPPAYLPTDNDFPATPIKDPEISDLERLIITGNKEPSYLPTDNDFPATPIPTPTTPGATPAPKVSAPAVKPTTPAPSAPSSGMDLMGLLALLGGQQQPMQQAPMQAPMQDPYAHIKLMEDLFGSTIDLTPAGENTAQRK
jgi:hypothetical protein